MNIAKIYRYPVKGLSAEALTRVSVVPGESLPSDRRYALAHGSTAFDPAEPAWLPKQNFLMLAKNERLAKLETKFDDATTTLTVARNGKQVASGDLSSQSGRMTIESFFAAFMTGETRGNPKLVEAPGHMFSDTARKVVSLIGLASLRDLERVARAPVDPVRFRANLYFEGGKPWEEFEWLGRELVVGSTRLRVLDKIERCAATTVNPKTAERDLQIPRLLMDGFRHVDCGVYAQVLAPGDIAEGDAIKLD
jgi:uncharacterized protein